MGKSRPILEETAYYLYNYLNWVKAGAPDLRPFERSTCFAVQYKASSRVKDNLANVTKGVDLSFGSEGLLKEMLEGRVHKNRKRINYIKTLLKIYEKDCAVYYSYVDKSS